MYVSAGSVSYPTPPLVDVSIMSKVVKGLKCIYVQNIKLYIHLHNEFQLPYFKPILIIRITLKFVDFFF